MRRHPASNARSERLHPPLDGHKLAAGANTYRSFPYAGVRRASKANTDPLTLTCCSRRGCAKTSGCTQRLGCSAPRVQTRPAGTLVPNRHDSGERGRSSVERSGDARARRYRLALKPPRSFLAISTPIRQVAAAAQGGGHPTEEIVWRGLARSCQCSEPGKNRDWTHTIGPASGNAMG